MGQSFLCSRMQCVKAENILSQSLPITIGVPQGSTLGPTLFSIYINNIAQSTGNAQIHLYADDTILYCSHTTLHSALTNLQSSFLDIGYRMLSPIYTSNLILRKPNAWSLPKRNTLWTTSLKSPPWITHPWNLLPHINILDFG